MMHFNNYLKINSLKNSTWLWPFSKFKYKHYYGLYNSYGPATNLEKWYNTSKLVLVDSNNQYSRVWEVMSVVDKKKLSIIHNLFKFLWSLNKANSNITLQLYNQQLWFFWSKKLLKALKCNKFLSPRWLWLIRSIIKFIYNELLYKSLIYNKLFNFNSRKGLYKFQNVLFNWGGYLNLFKTFKSWRKPLIGIKLKNIYSWCFIRWGVFHNLKVYKQFLGKNRIIWTWLNNIKISVIWNWNNISKFFSVYKYKSILASKSTVSLFWLSNKWLQAWQFTTYVRFFNSNIKLKRKKILNRGRWLRLWYPYIMSNKLLGINYFIKSNFINFLTQRLMHRSIMKWTNSKKYNQLAKRLSFYKLKKRKYKGQLSKYSKYFFLWVWFWWRRTIDSLEFFYNHFKFLNDSWWQKKPKFEYLKIEQLPIIFESIVILRFLSYNPNIFKLFEILKYLKYVLIIFKWLIFFWGLSIGFFRYMAKLFKRKWFKKQWRYFKWRHPRWEYRTMPRKYFLNWAYNKVQETFYLKSLLVGFSKHNLKFKNWSKYFLVKLFNRVRAGIYNKQQLAEMYRSWLITFNDYKHARYDIMFNLWWRLLLLIFKYWVLFKWKLNKFIYLQKSVKLLLLHNSHLIKWLIFLLSIFNWLQNLSNISYIKGWYVENLQNFKNLKVKPFKLINKEAVEVQKKGKIRLSKILVPNNFIVITESFSNKFYKGLEFDKIRERFNWSHRRDTWMDRERDYMRSKLLGWLTDRWYTKGIKAVVSPIQNENTSKSQPVPANNIDDFIEEALSAIDEVDEKIKEEKLWREAIIKGRRKDKLMRTSGNYPGIRQNKTVKAYLNKKLHPTLRYLNNLLYAHWNNIINVDFNVNKSFIFKWKVYQPMFILYKWIFKYYPTGMPMDKLPINALWFVKKLIHFSILVDRSWNKYINLKFINKRHLNYYKKAMSQKILNDNNKYIFFYTNYMQFLFNKLIRNKKILNYSWIYKTSNHFKNYYRLLKWKLNSNYFWLADKSKWWEVYLNKQLLNTNKYICAKLSKSHPLKEKWLINGAWRIREISLLDTKWLLFLKKSGLNFTPYWKWWKYENYSLYGKLLSFKKFIRYKSFLKRKRGKEIKNRVRLTKWHLYKTSVLVWRIFNLGDNPSLVGLNAGKEINLKKLNFVELKALKFLWAKSLEYKIDGALSGYRYPWQLIYDGLDFSSLYRFIKQSSRKFIVGSPLISLGLSKFSNLFMKRGLKSSITNILNLLKFWIRWLFIILTFTRFWIDLKFCKFDNIFITFNNFLDVIKWYFIRIIEQSNLIHPFIPPKGQAKKYSLFLFQYFYNFKRFFFASFWTLIYPIVKWTIVYWGNRTWIPAFEHRFSSGHKHSWQNIFRLFLDKLYYSIKQDWLNLNFWLDILLLLSLLSLRFYTGKVSSDVRSKLLVYYNESQEQRSKFYWFKFFIWWLS